MIYGPRGVYGKILFISKLQDKTLVLWPLSKNLAMCVAVFENEHMSGIGNLNHHKLIQEAIFQSNINLEVIWKPEKFDITVQTSQISWLQYRTVNNRFVNSMIIYVRIMIEKRNISWFTCTFHKSTVFSFINCYIIRLDLLMWFIVWSRTNKQIRS